MSDFLWQSYHRLIAELDIPYRRFLYHQLNLKHRLIGVVGPRGVGKTTMLLQYIKENLYDKNNVFYFSADNIFFNETSMLEFVNQLYLQKDIRIFFIDEVHRYANWNQELKNIYDSFPDAHVVFSGSSSIDLIDGAYDLSRRAKLLHLPGMSFREFLNIKTGNNFKAISFTDLVDKHQKIAGELSRISTIAQYFEEYLLFGYYPIVFQNRDDLYDAISNVIDKTVYEDIANFYSLKTNNLVHLKRILSFLASIPPGEVKTNNIAAHVGIDNKTIDNYLQILQKTGMIKMLYPVATGNQILRKPAKIYLDNTTLLATMNTVLSAKLDVGTLRELAVMQFLSGAGLTAFYPKKGDFFINDIVFEVGGNNKTKQQINTYEGRKMLIKDNMLIGSKNEIPLYLFGFLY